VLAVPAVRAADGMDPDLQRRAKRAIAGGLHYLRGQQAPDGSVLKSVGITALSLRAFMRDGTLVANGHHGVLAAGEAGDWARSFVQVTTCG
jgi:hypothetical protein